MNELLPRCCALLLLAFGVVALKPAHAVDCTISMTDMSFASVDPQSTQTDSTATLSYRCTAGILERFAMLCFSIGNPDGGSTSSRQMRGAGSNTLDFQLYQDPARSSIWGSQFVGAETPHQLSLEFSILGTRSGTITMYGRVAGGQANTPPGTYTSTYGSGHTRLTINPGGPISGPPSSCNTNPANQREFPFTVSATVINKCAVTVNPLHFGTNLGLLTTAVDASTTLGVQCSSGTAYNIGLNAGQNGGGDINARAMVLGAGSVHYQLYRDAARSQVWGNTIGTNTVTATGNGNTQYQTVYGQVLPQTTPSAGTYNDIVTVTVTY